MVMNELDQVEILTLQDNYIDMTATDDSAMIHRAGSPVAGEIRKSIQQIEAAMPDRFILNMSGTRLTFTA
jgi:hypothetical protein